MELASAKVEIGGSSTRICLGVGDCDVEIPDEDIAGRGGAMGDEVRMIFRRYQNMLTSLDDTMGKVKQAVYMNHTTTSDRMRILEKRTRYTCEYRSQHYRWGFSTRRDNSLEVWGC